MKKILALILGLVVLFSAVGAMAEVQTMTTTGPSTGTTVNYSVTQTISVTIPDSVEIGATGTVSVTNAIIPYGENLTVTITDAQNKVGNVPNIATEYRLKDGDNENYLEYSVKTGEDPSKVPVEIGKPFLTVSAGTKTGTATLDFALADGASVTKAGTYTDKLTFTVSVVQPSTP